jgi:pimeloyl-ACP methyl ester carboxylesterase
MLRPVDIRKKAAELCAQSYHDSSIVEFGDMEVMYVPWNGINFLIWRGSDEGYDWLRNLRFFSRKVKAIGRFHRGYWNNIENYHADIFNLIPIDAMDDPIIVAGHSKGGAEAQLFLIRHLVRVDQCITFGSPKPIKKIYSDEVEETIRRKTTHYINPYDTVTKLPPRSDAIGKEVRKKIKQKGLFKIEHLMALYLRFFDDV